MTKMNFKRLYFLCVISLLSNHLNAQISEQAKSEVDRILSQLSADEPGIIIGIATGTEIFYAKGKGSEVLGKNIPLTPQTPFYLS